MPSATIKQRILRPWPGQLAFALLGILLTISGRSLLADPLPAKASVDEVLDALDQSGKSLEGFTATLTETTTDPNAALGNDKVRTGAIWFQKHGDDQRVRVLYDKVINGRLAEEHKIEYLLEGPWLVDRNYDQKSETRRQVLEPGQKLNLLKLGEGPFPLPVGQDKNDVKKAFDVQLVAPAKGDPANTIHLSLTPLPDTHMAKKLSSLDLWVDRSSKMPAVIDTLDANKTQEHRIELSDLKLNPKGGLPDSDFALAPIDSAWNQRTEKFQE